MALGQSPSVVTNGLTFYYDMNNTQKSWKGRPITNQFAIPTPAGDGSVTFQVQGAGTFYRIGSGTYGGYSIQPTDVVYRFSPTASGQCWYHGNDVTINAGQTATWSFDYYVDPSITGYVSTNYLANFEGVVGGAITDPSPAIIGVWKRLTVTATASSTGTCRMLIYPGACGGYLASGGFVLFKNPQVEFDAPGNNPSPFVAGTRSSTQTVLDLTNSTTLTANSLTYNSDGTFNFAQDNASSTITIPLSTSFNKLTGTIGMWVNPAGYSGSNGLFVNRDTNTANAVDWLWAGSWDSANVFYFRLGDGSSCCNNDLTLSSWASYCPLNTWTFVTVSWTSGGTSKIYTNGVLRTSRSISSIPATNPTATGRIGLGHESPGSWNGKIGVAQIYNRQLADSEVLSNFNALRGRYNV